MRQRNMMTFLWSGLLAVGLVSRAGAYGSGDVGSSGAAFLKVGPGARQGAMGEAFAGTADDVYSIYYNPAGLGNLSKVEAAGMHDQQFQGINSEFAAVS